MGPHMTWSQMHTLYTKPNCIDMYTAQPHHGPWEFITLKLSSSSLPSSSFVLARPYPQLKMPFFYEKMAGSIFEKGSKSCPFSFIIKINFYSSLTCKSLINTLFCLTLPNSGVQITYST